MSLQAYCLRHHGIGEAGNQGTGLTVVVASRESIARQLVWDYLTAKPGGNTQCQSPALFECELLEDTELSGLPVALTEAGVIAEYYYRPDGEEQECAIVYVKDADKLADELFCLQEPQNEGRGISCVRTLCEFMRRGKLSEARAVATNESDKISSYPAIVEALKRVGFWRESLFCAEL
ncbi:MAG: hypothetical protein K2W82_17725 [Candidatus Obscuribacterales bacterium]|nr:hypothetical protein [Candidatus Obscuribacterales bacterium]